MRRTGGGNRLVCVGAGRDQARGLLDRGAQAEEARAGPGCGICSGSPRQRHGDSRELGTEDRAGVAQGLLRRAIWDKIDLGQPKEHGS